MINGDSFSKADPDIERGVKAIKDYLPILPAKPGVYRMIDARDGVLYVGKAKALKHRVRSYTHFDKLPNRLKRMVSLTVRMEFITTQTEAEALMLEANLIKKFRPAFNILLRDDKSFPYIVMRDDHDFPQLLKHRGAKSLSGQYFGPFPSAGDVNRTITLLQRVFQLRNCTDGYFENRSRPCLQYHIKRCSAPCVGKVSVEAYKRQVEGAHDFMLGKSRAVQERFADEMRKASAELDYERAAQYRDRIRALTSIQASQDINSTIGDCDVVAMIRRDGVSCFQMFFYRSGRNMGNKSYFPRHTKEESDAEILAAFVAQFYDNKSIPPVIVLSEAIDDQEVYEDAFSSLAGRKVQLIVPQKGRYKRALDFAIKNSEHALERHMAQSSTRLKLRKAVADLFGLDAPPERIEVYDNSHISGTNMVGAMVVEGADGFVKKGYRTFNIKRADAADDYGMMREVLSRRFKRALEEGSGPGDVSWPDLLLIDGGAGQLNAGLSILEEFGIIDDVVVVAIAKGEDRHAGREKFFMRGREMFQLPINDPVLHYLQRLRDEAHRFAIGAHRKKRSRNISKSPLDDIPGVGGKRKKALLTHFGSAKSVRGAAVEDLMKVDGVSRSLAQTIYNYFHEQ